MSKEETKGQDFNDYFSKKLMMDKFTAVIQQKKSDSAQKAEEFEDSDPILENTNYFPYSTKLTKRDNQMKQMSIFNSKLPPHNLSQKTSVISTVK